MRRRRYLRALVSGVPLLAGCFGGGGDGNATTTTRSSGSTTAPPGATSSRTPTSATPRSTVTTPRNTSASTGRVEVVSVALREVDTRYGPEQNGVIDVQNESDTSYEYVEVSATFYDDDGNVVGGRSSNIENLPPGKTWRVYLTPIGVDTDRLADVSATVSETFSGEPYRPASELPVAVVERSIRGRSLFGRAQNTGDDTLDYLKAGGTFYDREGRIRFTDSAVTSLQAGGTWEFELRDISTPEYPISRVVLGFSTSP